MRHVILGRPSGLAIAAVALLGAAPSIRADEGGAVEVGASPLNKLQIHSHIPLPIVLPPSTFAGVPGFLDNVGFHSLPADEPSHNLFALLPSANISFVLISSSTNAHVLAGAGSLLPGQPINFGNAPFDYHQVFTVDSGTPGVPYGVTFRMHDSTGLYTDSDPFTLSFTPVPEPSAFPLLMAGTSLLLLRRRSRALPVRV